MWLTDGTRTSIVRISQISAANAGDYSCQASFNGQSAKSTVVIQLNGKWHIIELNVSVSKNILIFFILVRLEPSSPTTTVIASILSATLSCELYGYITGNSPTILWNFGGDELKNDSVFTITTKDGSHMIQNGGDSPRPSVRSILTIDLPNKTHEGTYFCTAGSSLSRIDLQVLEVVEGRSSI